MRATPTTKACIIGAGSSGIIAAKVLRERGNPFDCFEMGSDIGGLWRYGNDTGRSPAYASLETNTSRDRTGYGCFPIPRELPDYLHHTQLLEYFEDFVEHFVLREAITFRTRVVRVARADPPATEAGAPEAPAVGDGVVPGRAPIYEVTVRDLETEEERAVRYGAVLVASGHHWDPSRPDFPGEFSGIQLHSHSYRTPDLLAGRRVLVVGIGNSACDIACEAAGVAERTLLSTRRSAHVLPKRVLGRPLDRWITPLSSRLPFAAQRTFLSLLLRIERGDQERYGVPKPAHRLGEEHPTISRGLLELVEAGRIEVKPNVQRLAGEAVRFEDGTEEEVDVAIYATGYRVSFPFLDPGSFGEEVPRPPGNRLPLFRHVVPPDHPGLYFIGLVQPLGAIPPLAEAQSEWVGDLLEGKAALPPREEMWREIEKTERALRSRYVRSRRHTMEVDFFPYLREVERERRRGRRRRPGGAEPVEEAVPDARAVPTAAAS